MTDVKKLGMTELIALYNQLAEKAGVSPETSFKSLAAARTAVENLEKKMEAKTEEKTEAPFDGATPVGETPAPNADAPVAAGDRNKYNSTGMRGPNQGVGAFAKEQIMAGKTNAEALAAVLAKFPGAKTTTGCIAFYRTALTKASKVAGPTAEQLRAQAQELLAKAEAAEKAETEAKVAAAAAEAAQATTEETPAQ